MSKLTLALLVLHFTSTIQYTDEFHEELYIKPLETGHINSYFQFTTSWDRGEQDNRK